MEKFNLVELLRNCPIGMELDCTMFEDAKIYKIDDSTENEYPIRIEAKNGFLLDLTKYGTYADVEEAKCVIFPKGKTTWEGFVPPCKFKDGDVVTYKFRGSLVAFIYKDRIDTMLVKSHFALYVKSIGFSIDGDIIAKEDEIVFATEEEKERLFDALKDNGYKWNQETKTLERFPKFKVGDRIKKEEKFATIIRVHKNCYDVRYDSGIGSFTINLQDDWELVSPNKFDITTLKPFDKVLVRGSYLGKWHIQFFERYDKNASIGYQFVCIGGNKYGECIPYEGNEYLLNPTDNCDKV